MFKRIWPRNRTESEDIKVWANRNLDQYQDDLDWNLLMDYLRAEDLSSTELSELKTVLKERLTPQEYDSSLTWITPPEVESP